MNVDVCRKSELSVCVSVSESNHLATPCSLQYIRRVAGCGTLPFEREILKESYSPSKQLLNVT